MYCVKVVASFDGAHFLSNYEGKCSNIHGHRWNVEADVVTENLIEYGQNAGMVQDFSDVKVALKRIVDEYDHALIIERDSMRPKTLECLDEDGFKIVTVDFRTTAENFAYNIFLDLKANGYNVRRVTVYETPNNAAIYEE